MSMVVINSTGQTAEDLAGLLQLGQLSGGKPFTPPALLDPNYIPPNRGPQLFDVALALFILSFTAVALRMVARYTSKIGKVLWEDWAILIALVLNFGTMLLDCLATSRWQLGMHVYDLHIEHVNLDFKTSYPYEILNLWCMTFVRISIILFVRRLYSDVGSRWVKFCNYFIGINVVLALAGTLAFTLNCHAAATGRASIFQALEAGCASVNGFYAITAFGVVFDLLVVALPIKLVWSLTLPTRKKLEVVGMFALGLLTCAASIARFAFLYSATQDPDFTWNVVDTSICCQLEMCLAIIAACIPSIKALFVTVKQSEQIASMTKSFGSSKRSPQNSNNSHDLSAVSRDVEIELEDGLQKSQTLEPDYETYGTKTIDHVDNRPVTAQTKKSWRPSSWRSSSKQQNEHTQHPFPTIEPTRTNVSSSEISSSGWSGWQPDNEHEVVPQTYLSVGEGSGGRGLTTYDARKLSNTLPGSDV